MSTMPTAISSRLWLSTTHSMWLGEGGPTAERLWGVGGPAVLAQGPAQLSGLRCSVAWPLLPGDRARSTSSVSNLGTPSPDVQQGPQEDHLHHRDGRVGLLHDVCQEGGLSRRKECVCIDVSIGWISFVYTLCTAPFHLYLDIACTIYISLLLFISLSHCICSL